LRNTDSVSVVRNELSNLNHTNVPSRNITNTSKSGQLLGLVPFPLTILFAVVDTIISSKEKIRGSFLVVVTEARGDGVEA
jgi:hypothetical protein